ncbi:precorrin-6y C5,15-methyltransferase (decarboxylating) subunit CbiE [Reinekea marinisedimentorum]|uniref:Precorrin-6Y C5,15-methyltransferase (Decarboxylating) n=1 Tax=Reinekea marinisedimentorum TaxID=230495 RepID=A0A4V2UJ81_9GAMM|nr:precorrin-6y C5,15-methyltransferase (decarboxylating) subunit CbiE [Reinekea marinisedimentorum]TCS39040.1 precorrin-6Y C5,15-methyltransferase (decarboxylating) [Reinekea marinisedimentorum]
MSVSIRVIGVPEDGCVSLTSQAVNAVASARVVAGHARHMAWFPQFSGTFLDMGLGFSRWLNQLIDESEEGSVVVLASGDPLFFGIGNTLLKKLPADELAFLPSQSSAQLAFARLGLPWDQARFISCHGRAPVGEGAGLVSQMQQGKLFAVLTDAHNNPQRIAAHLLRYQQHHWRVHVCEQLGGTEERISTFTVAQLAETGQPFDALNILVIQASTANSWGGYGQFAGDDAFLKRTPKAGLITKQAVRNLVLTQLGLNSESTFWDVGSGSGSVAIEAAKLCWHGQVFAVECNPECFSSIEANSLAHGTDNLKLIRTKAPEGLDALPQPQAVFIGGSRGQMDAILSSVWQRLADNGKLAVSAVTLETVAEVVQWAKQAQVELQCQLINVSETQPLAHYQRYQAQNPIHLFLMTKISTNKRKQKES